MNTYKFEFELSSEDVQNLINVFDYYDNNYRMKLFEMENIYNDVIEEAIKYNNELKNKIFKNVRLKNNKGI